MKSVVFFLMLMGNKHSVLAVSCYRMETRLSAGCDAAVPHYTLLDRDTSSCVATHRRIHLKIEAGLPCGAEIGILLASPLPFYMVVPGLN